MAQIEPGDREEMLLAGILNKVRESNIDPATRKEALLKAILEAGLGDDLPEVDDTDNGKILTVLAGKWGKANPGSGNLPATSAADNGKILKVRDDTWATSQYAGAVEVIKITDATTTMGDVSTTLDAVNAAGEHVVFDVSALNAGMYLCTIYLGQGYYRIFDLVTGFEETGFFNANTLLSDIIKSGHKSEGKHYTVKWNQSTAACTRLNDAQEITTTTTNFGHFGAENPNYENPFDAIYPWSGRKLCNIDLDRYMALTAGDDITDCVTAWEDDEDFDYDDQYGVWVYTPPFFGRSYVIGNDRYFDVTDENTLGNVAYPATIVGRWLGVDVTLTINGTNKHCLLPKTGAPASGAAVSTYHTYAKNYKASLNDIYSLDATSLLYVVEYANMNLQSKLGSGVSDLYVQGLHPAAAVTAGNVITLSGLTSGQKACFIPGALIEFGTSDGGSNTGKSVVASAETDGSTTTVTLADNVTVTTSTFVSIHGMANIADETIGSKSGYIGTNGKSNAYYRGQTFYANKYQYILGSYRQTGTAKIWIAAPGETDNYDALDTSHHIDTGLTLPTNASAATSGYIQTLGMCDGLSLPPFCTAIGGDSAAPVGDYCYVPKTSDGNTILLLGGDAYNGTSCGWSGSWRNTSGVGRWALGACPRLKNP